MQRAFPQAGGARQARHLRSGRISGGVSGVLQWRIEPAPDRHAHTQPRGHGRRRGDSRQPDRRGGVAHRLRQDHAGPADGRGQLRRAGHRGDRRADAQRQARRQEHRLGHRRVATARSAQGRRDRAASLPLGRSGDVALGRHVQHDGHGVHHGVHGGGAGYLAAAQRGHPGGGCAALRAGAHVGHPHRRDGPGRAGAVEGPHARSVRERHPRERSDRRLDQCGHPPQGDCRAHRRAARARRLDAHRAQHADHR